MEKIYYIQKEEEQMDAYTNFSPQFYKNYDKAKEEFLKYIELEKKSLNHIYSQSEGYDCIMINGCDEWGDIRKVIYLRNGKII